MLPISRKLVLLSSSAFLPLLITGLVAGPRADAGLAPRDKTEVQDKRANKGEDERAGPGNNYGFSERTPSGKWSARAEFDAMQTDDPSVPVIIAAIRLYAGKGDWGRQLMIASATLMNRTATKISRVKLGWIIISKEDRNARKNQDAALVNGYTAFFTPEGSNPRIQKIESVYLDFVKEAKALVRAGTLSGDFYLRLRVSEVHFEDSSTWLERPQL